MFFLSNRCIDLAFVVGHSTGYGSRQSGAPNLRDNTNGLSAIGYRLQSFEPRRDDLTIVVSEGT